MSRPDILLILNDEMGFSDLGCYGGEARTPYLDSLAADLTGIHPPIDLPRFVMLKCLH